ncbi:hypothetical protein [Chitinophaga japonensis]|uniref:Uncharacterized protein n=1 Tax=Chitinophaga japonensis TaxID=104662 RepID=A0A562SZ38_CHIJA|nr:hypothetical protein [Chitinophaga japonensis]TWI86551.1 hypothetical protein LX66_3810 [Chitinophaga japonensis]
MLQNEPLAIALFTCLLLSGASLFVVFRCLACYPGKRKVRKPRRRMLLKRMSAPRLTLTVKDTRSSKRSAADAHLKAALQHTIEEAFSSN